MNHSVTFHPTDTHMKEIDAWLSKEYEETGNGFKANWKLIEAARTRNNLAVWLEKKVAVGFATWYLFERQTRLDFFCIQPDRRRHGLGKHFYQVLETHIRDKSAVVITLQCAPPESEAYWRNKEFQDFPWSTPAHGNTWLYKPLLEVAERIETMQEGEYIAIWDREPIYARDVPPKWIWKIQRVEGSLQLKYPIIFPCRSDWQLAWLKDGKILQANKAKRFINEDFYLGDMLYIDTLPDITK